MPSQHHIGGGWMWRVTRLAIYLRDRFRCVWCGRNVVALHPRNVTLDHLVPREFWGSNAPTNVVTACKGCNAARGPRTVRAFLRTLADPDGARRRLRSARRRKPQRALALAIVRGDAPDPRPVVRRARERGRILAPKGSAADRARRAA